MLTSLLSGGITGILGSLTSGIFKYFEKRQDYQHEVQLIELERQLSAQENEHELSKIETSADIEALKASYQMEQSWQGGSTWVINILRLVRPVLTILSFLGVILFWVSDRLNAEQISAIIDGTIYLATTSFTWWFGDRSRRKDK